ncbi:MAG: hypothetical protein J2P37_29715 [Ktedonobacteraceae bacterium]|nr:hypothetical protein [Ktedonobacteraceae bacterium]
MGEIRESERGQGTTPSASEPYQLRIENKAPTDREGSHDKPGTDLIPARLFAHDRAIGGDPSAEAREGRSKLGSGSDVVVAPEARALLDTGHPVDSAQVYETVVGERPPRCDWTTAFRSTNWWPLLESRSGLSFTPEYIPREQLGPQGHREVLPEVATEAQRLLENPRYRSQYEVEPGLAQVGVDQEGVVRLVYTDTSHVEERARQNLIGKDEDGIRQGVAHFGPSLRTGAHVVPLVREGEREYVMAGEKRDGSLGSVTEGASFSDGHPAPDPYRIVERGLLEELGVPREHIVERSLTTFGIGETGTMNPIGYARLDLTRQQLRDLWANAEDHGEFRDLQFVPFTIEDTLDALMRPENTWLRTTPPTLVHLLVDKYGEQTVKSAIEQRAAHASSST